MHRMKKKIERNEKAAAYLRRLERMTHERNMLLETVLFIRKVARRSPDEHMFFVGACDEVLECLAASRRQEKRRKI
jgi:hypothetical protein